MQVRPCRVQVAENEQITTRNRPTKQRINNVVSQSLAVLRCKQKSVAPRPRGSAHVLWCGTGTKLWPREVVVDQSGLIYRNRSGGLDVLDPSTVESPYRVNVDRSRRLQDSVARNSSTFPANHIASRSLMKVPLIAAFAIVDCPCSSRLPSVRRPTIEMANVTGNLR